MNTLARPHFAIVGVALASVVAIVLWTIYGNGEPAPDPVASTPRSLEDPAAAPAHEAVEVSAPLEEHLREPTAVPPSGRRVLEDLWGPIPRDIEATLKTEVDLDAPFDFGPWEEAADHFAQTLGDLTQEEFDNTLAGLVGWPTELTPDSLRAAMLIDKNTPLGEVEMEAIHNLVAEDVATINDLARTYCEGLRTAKRAAWARGDYTKSPMTTRMIPKNARAAFYTTASAHRGWAAKIHLFSDENQDLLQLLEQVEARKGERDRKIRTYVASLK